VAARAVRAAVVAEHPPVADLEPVATDLPGRGHSQESQRRGPDGGRAGAGGEPLGDPVDRELDDPGHLDRLLRVEPGSDAAALQAGQEQ
jgi:hypothetical protein